MFRRHKPRRGVVLLVVLTLLTLLIVLGVTLVVVSGTFRRGAETAARQERYGDDPEQLMDRAMYQLVRDTPPTSPSAMRGHSLLGDLVGNDAIQGTVESITSSGGEFLTFTTEQTSLNPRKGHYNGCTLSFLDPVVDQSTGNKSMIAPSTRIVKYEPETNSITVEWSAGEYGVDFLPQAGDRFLINGRPFNGTGAGYTFDSHSLDHTVSFPQIGLDAETALLPNYSSYADLTSNSGPALGGLDEPWDAVDFQNMFLAMVPPDVSSGIIPSFHRPALVNYWIKRLADHLGLAPTTMAEYFREPSTAPEELRSQITPLKRSMILRPLPEDHPNFGNAENRENFKSTMGQTDLSQMIWDVDNDGDGIPDSVWMDVGLPIRTDDSGRRYKPLVAILCQDLDGRLNVNAHGSVAHMESVFASDGELQRTPKEGDRRYFASGNLRERVPRGLGVGPAEIYLGHVFRRTDGAGHLLDLGHVFSQRYQLPVLVYDGNGNIVFNRSQGEYYAARGAGANDRDDALSQIKSLGIPSNYSGELSAYGSPPDLWGNGGIGLDYTGHPIRIDMGKSWTWRDDDDNLHQRGETDDDPYEIVLNRKSAGRHDAPFTLAELERVLRYDDVDAFGLPNRLVHNSILNDAVTALHGNSAEARRNRRLITTCSSHIPTIAGVLPKKMRDFVSNATSNSIFDLYRARIKAELGSDADPEPVMKRIVPWEIWHGQRFNVNRWLGNGEDDNGNGVVDEPLEADNDESIWPSGLAGGFSDNGVNFNYLNDDPALTDPALPPPQSPLTSRNRFAPQIYARHLYCLMMLLSDHLNEDYFHPTQENLNGMQRRELTAQRLAQWAINVVDFRDANAIMTPFEYDINPFNGWQLIDGDPRTNEGGERRVVWGAEYPDLLLTESLALHDVRWKDTEWDDSGKKTTDPDPNEPDNTTDQYRIPEGSLFLELYCTRTRFEKRVEEDDRWENHAMFPRELYNPVYDPSDPSEVIDYQLDLSRMAGDSPVWRIAITRSYDDEQSPDQRRETRPDTTSFQPQTFEQPSSMSLVSPTGGVPDVLDVERYVWFTNRDPATTELPPLEQQKIYYNRNDPTDPTNAQLPPASYLVVGPRPITHKGSQEQAGDSPQYDPSNNRIELAGTNIATYSSDDNLRTPGTNFVKPARTIVAAANAPIEVDSSGTVVPDSEDAWNLDLPIGLNVSEPIPLFGPDPDEQSYYDEPEYRLTPDFPLDSYYQHEPAPQQGKLPTKPFDTRDWSPLIQDGIVDEGEDENPEFEPRLEEDYKTAFLQRLANPTEPWDPTGNPYITVDWTPIDLTVFNGEDDNPESIDIDQFVTRERGGKDERDPNLWSVDTSRHSPGSATASEDYFQLDLGESLGYLNEVYKLQAGGRLDNSTSDDYKGDPKKPFPWLVWHNRPFANPMELMQVPASTPSRLTHEFDVTPADPPPPLPELELARTHPYEAQEYRLATPSTDSDVGTFRGRFPHLLNFFHSSDTDQVNRRGANFYRLFDYVETPSRFVGAEKWYEPTSMIGGDKFHFHPPYNYFSRFQDPGRVNINTIFDSRVWEGIAKSFPEMDPTVTGGYKMYESIFKSRRGYPTPAEKPGEDRDRKFYKLNSDYPTLFANPFRAADSADLMPDVPADGGYSMRKDQPVQATLLRHLLTDPTQPLFVPDPAAVSSVTEEHRDQDRNSYFRYQGLARLSNLVSNNSNVFAVWITLGYFEVEPNPPSQSAPDGVDSGHPDGFALGRELGSVTGEVKRHRAFYIIDRSEPVAFEPGQNHNVDNCILLRRFIE